MKAFSGDRPLLKFCLLIYLTLLVGLFSRVWPDLRSKISAQKNDRRVVLSADWEDVTAFSNGKEAELLKILRLMRAHYIMMSSGVEKLDETLVRSTGFQVLWRLDDQVRPGLWVPRFRKGDAIFLAGEHVLEHPQLMRELPALLESNDGFLCAMEFYPDALLPAIAKKLPARIIKSHLLPTREMIYPKVSIWTERLVRAVESRWVRHVLIRFSPGLDTTENLDFQVAVVSRLEKEGYTLGAPALFSLWGDSPFAAKWRLNAVLIVSILMPVLAVWWARSSGFSSPWVMYLGINALALASGTVIHALGSTPAMVTGIQILRGVKLQLVAPLFASALFLLNIAEVKRWLDQPIKFKHLAVFGVGIAGLLGLYLMRSGNFPVIAVTDAERQLRDILEQVLVARPRFKEFLIGQPLLILGLMQIKEGETPTVTARAMLWAGMIGQISIMNTFTHFHSPFELGVIRSLHGIWIGALVALPFVPWFKRSA